MKPGNLNEDARRVIAAGRAGAPAPELVRARVRRSVAAKLLSGGVAVSLVHASSLLAAGGMKVGIAVAVAGTVSVGAWYGLSEAASGTAASVVQAPSAWEARKIASALDRKSPASETAGEPQRTAANEGMQQTPEKNGEPARERAPTKALRAAGSNAQGSVRDNATEPTTRASSITEEVALLSNASTKLNQGDAVGAAQLLRQYDQQFKAKVLIQERVATGVLVQCALGNVEVARKAAGRFHKSWPRSPLARRIAGSCAGDAVKR